MLGGGIGNREANHNIRVFQYFLERRLSDARISDLGKGIRHRHTHTKRQRHFCQALADAPIANNPKLCCRKLQTHAALWQCAGPIGTDHSANIARQINHETNAEFHDRINKARCRARHQNPRRTGSRHIDGGDIHRHAQKGQKLWHRGEGFGKPLRCAIRNNGMAPARRFCQGSAGQNGSARVANHLSMFGQGRKGTRAVIAFKHFWRVR